MEVYRSEDCIMKPLLSVVARRLLLAVRALDQTRIRGVSSNSSPFANV